MASKAQVLVRAGFPFNYDTNVASDASGFDSTGEVDRAVQSSKEECDINTIVKRFGLTGQLPTNVRAPTYGDFRGVVDFQTAMNQVVAARESFERMPADVRTRFHNDPQEFVEFCSDEKNRPEAEKLGLVVPKVLIPKEEVKVEPKA